MGSSFELLFSIRPHSLTGLLLHVGDSSRSRYGPAMGQYLIVYMLGGEVRPRSVVLPAQSGLGKHISWLFVSFNHSSQSTALMLYCMFSILMFWRQILKFDAEWQVFQLKVCSPCTRLKSAVSGSFLQVVAQVNNGNGDFMVSVKPKASLCDGMFHKISGKMHKVTSWKTKEAIRTLIWMI